MTKHNQKLPPSFVKTHTTWLRRWTSKISIASLPANSNPKMSLGMYLLCLVTNQLLFCDYMLSRENNTNWSLVGEMSLNPSAVSPARVPNSFATATPTGSTCKQSSGLVPQPVCAWSKSNFLGLLPKRGKDQWDCGIANHYLALPLQQKNSSSPFEYPYVFEQVVRKMFWTLLSYTVTKECASPRNLTWFTRPFLLMRGQAEEVRHGWPLLARLPLDSAQIFSALH